MPKSFIYIFWQTTDKTAKSREFVNKTNTSSGHNSQFTTGVRCTLQKVVWHMRKSDWIVFINTAIIRSFGQWFLDGVVFCFVFILFATRSQLISMTRSQFNSALPQIRAQSKWTRVDGVGVGGWVTHSLHSHGLVYRKDLSRKLLYWYNIDINSISTLLYWLIAADKFILFTKPS